MSVSDFVLRSRHTEWWDLAAVGAELARRLFPLAHRCDGDSGSCDRTRRAT